MWDRLRALGYKGSFLMIHNSGGSGEVFKTTASRTYNESSLLLLSSGWLSFL
jgi:hypothetical protein